MQTDLDSQLSNVGMCVYLWHQCMDTPKCTSIKVVVVAVCVFMTDHRARRQTGHCPRVTGQPKMRQVYLRELMAVERVT